MNRPAIPPIPRPRSFDWRELLEQLSMIGVLLALILLCSVLVDNFATFRNTRNILLLVSTVGMVACTMVFCLASGNFDLSVGATVSCSGVVAALVVARTGSFALALLAVGGLGILVGALNGVIVAVLRINPLIATLGTMQIITGFKLLISEGKSIGIANNAFLWLGDSSLLRIQTPIWLCAACFVLFGLVLELTTFGRNTLAIGGNEEAARLAGVPVTLTKILIFTLQGLVAALAGVVLASRMGSGQPNTAQGFELSVISACVLGGVSLTGGIGRMHFVIAGVLIMGVVQNAMDLRRINPFWQYVVLGSVLLAAVLFDRLKQKRGG